MRIDKTRLLYLLMAVAVTGFLACCDDCPNCPGDNPPEAGDYYLIGYDITQQIVVLIDIPADTIIDTIHCGFDSYDMVAHPDSDKFMMLNNTDGTIEVYETSTLEHLETINQFGIYYFDVDDGYGLWFSPQDSALYKINTSTLSPIDTISRIFISDSFLDTLHNRFYASKFEEEWVYIIDCENMAKADSFRTESSVVEIAYSAATNQVFYISPSISGGELHRYNLSDSTDYFLEYLRTIAGGITITPDQKYILITDGADPLHGILSNPFIYIFNTESATLDVIAATPFIIYPPAGLMIFGNIAVTSDSRRAYVSAVPSWYGGPSPIGVIDIYSKKMIGTIELPTQYFSYSNVLITPKINNKVE